jgi:hypothetical protein
MFTMPASLMVTDRAFLSGILADIWSENKKFRASFGHTFGHVWGPDGRSEAMFPEKAKERQPSTAKLLRAALMTLPPLTAWIV